MTPEQQQAVTLKQQGMSRRDIAQAMGVTERRVKYLFESARKQDPAMSAAMQAVGTNLTPRMMWAKTHKDGSTTYSTLLREDGAESVKDLVKDVLTSEVAVKVPAYNRRVHTGGENLLVIDVADLHVGKLASEVETGTGYSSSVAATRMASGIEGLIKKAEPNGIDRILFVTGNDVLHTDNRGHTTSGTPQDTDSTLFDMFRAASDAVTAGVAMCSEVAPVDMLHCPSNHDYYMGWACMQAVAAKFESHKHVSASKYNMSERHRKYYGYGYNGFMLTHGDGAKEESLYGLFLSEARDLVSKTRWLYSINHHLHHKIAKNRGGRKPEMTEKDGVSVIMHNKHIARTDDDGLLKVEHVRSPSASDSWHHRNGYVSRQAVECFLHHEVDGQTARFTEWF